MISFVLAAAVTCTQLSVIATEVTINDSVWLPRNTEQYRWMRLMDDYRAMFPDRTDLPNWIYNICMQEQGASI